MKKRAWILLLIIALFLLPHTASANSPVRRPWMMQVECENVAAGTRIDVELYREDGASRRLEDVYRSNQMPGVVFEAEDGETSFCLVCIDEAGTETKTETVPLSQYGLYRYDGAANSLTPNGVYYSSAQNCEGVGGLLLSCLLFPVYLLLLLVAALAVTLLIEWLVALCFGIRPVKFVFAINAITNPVMNILLLIASLLLSFSRVAYWVMLALLEIAVVFIEYRYYRSKYPETGKTRLLLFSITANALSLALGGLLQYWIL